jgi:hypothetical protein
MSSLPTFDNINNVNVFNGTSQYLQIAPTTINLANGLAIVATFTPTAVTPTSGETLCSFFQSSSTTNAITIARTGTTSQFNLNYINSTGGTQSIPIGNLTTGNKYQLIIQSSLTGTNNGASILTANQSLTTYYVGSALISSITAYATSLIVNYTSSGFLTSTPLAIYLYNGTSWNQVGSTTCLASGSSTITSGNILANQSSIYKLALSVISDGATYYNYNNTQLTNTSFNTPPIPIMGTVTPYATQFTISAASSYSGGYLSTTGITYYVSLAPYTTYTNAISSTLGASSTTIGNGTLPPNTQYSIQGIISDPVTTTIYSSTPIYTLATVSFVATPVSSLTSSSFIITWNSGSYYNVSIRLTLTASPYTQVFSQTGITANTFTFSTNTSPIIAANTGYTVSLLAYNQASVVNMGGITTTIITYGVILTASATAAYASASITWTATSGITTVAITAIPTANPSNIIGPTQYSTNPAIFLGLTANTAYTFNVAAVNSSGTNPSAIDLKTTNSITTPSGYYLDAVTTSSPLMIYSTRKLLTTYTNAVIRIQRSSDNSQSDFFAASNQQLYTGANGTGTSLTTWLSSATGYIVIWYNQVSGGVNLTGSASSTCVITLTSNSNYVVTFVNATSALSYNSQVTFTNATFAFNFIPVSVTYGGTPTAQNSNGDWFNCDAIIYGEQPSVTNDMSICISNKTTPTISFGTGSSGTDTFYDVTTLNGFNNQASVIMTRASPTSTTQLVNSYQGNTSAITSGTTTISASYSQQIVARNPLIVGACTLNIKIDTIIMYQSIASATDIQNIMNGFNSYKL